MTTDATLAPGSLAPARQAMAPTIDLTADEKLDAALHAEARRTLATELVLEVRYAEREGVVSEKTLEILRDKALEVLRQLDPTVPGDRSLLHALGNIHDLGLVIRA